MMKRLKELLERWFPAPEPPPKLNYLPFSKEPPMQFARIIADMYRCIEQDDRRKAREAEEAERKIVEEGFRI